MSNEELQKNVIKDVTLLKLVGFKPIIVHGGGKAISKWVAKAGKEPVFVNGLRVTDAETMEIAEMVLGRVNKNLVAMVQGAWRTRSWHQRQGRRSSAGGKEIFRWEGYRLCRRCDQSKSQDFI